MNQQEPAIAAMNYEEGLSKDNPFKSNENTENSIMAGNIDE